MVDNSKRRWELSVRIAGNTGPRCLAVLRAKGYDLHLHHDKQVDGSYLADYQASKDGRRFSATSPDELLGLVAMWEHRGDDWRPLSDEEIAMVKQLDDSALTYDRQGELESDD